MKPVPAIEQQSILRDYFAGASVAALSMAYCRGRGIIAEIVGARQPSGTRKVNQRARMLRKR